MEIKININLVFFFCYSNVGSSHDGESLASPRSINSSVISDSNFPKNDKKFSKLHKWAYIGDIDKLKKFLKQVSTA